MNFEGFLNYAIPILVILIFCGLFYVNPKIKSAVDTVFHWLGSGLGWAFGKTKEKGVQTYETVYRYG